MITLSEYTIRQRRLAIQRLVRMDKSILEIKHNLNIPNDVSQYLSGAKILIHKALESMKEFNKERNRV